MLLRSGLSITIPKIIYTKELLLSGIKESQTENELLKIFNDLNVELYKKGCLVDIKKDNLLLVAKEKRTIMKETNNMFWTKKVAKEFGTILKKMKILELLSEKIQNADQKKGFCGYLTKINKDGAQFEDTPLMPNIHNGYCSKILFTKISCGERFLVALTPDGKVFTAGSCNFGQLGHGNKNRIEILTEVKNLPKIKCISAGYAYTCVVTNKGAIYSWGAGQDGRLGNNTEIDSCIPVKLYTDWVADSIETGSTHTVAISRNKKLYSWGSAHYNGHNIQQPTLVPKKIESIKNIMFYKVSIGYGGYHTLALSYAGNVYSWGHNRVGQLGTSIANCVKNDSDHMACYNPTPYICESLIGIPVVNISAGWGHSAIITANNKIYMCGRNFRGQIGINPAHCHLNERGHPCSFKFTLLNNIPGHKEIKKVMCGGEHTIILTKDGEMISWGDNKFSQLGDSNNEDFRYHPKLIEKKSLSHYFNGALGSDVTFMLDCNISNFNLD